LTRSGVYAYYHTPTMLPTIRIEDNGVPIYVQLRDQMLSAIGAGVLRPGEQMPTMRQVAVALKVDLNTVRHAYDELEQAGAIVMRRGRGTYVASTPRLVDPAKQARRLESFAHQVIAMASAAGFDPSDVAREITHLTKRKGSRS
jgi:GntR family transcriptional regulator